MNRRALLKGLPTLITVPAVLKVGADASVPVSSGKATITTAAEAGSRKRFQG